MIDCDLRTVRLISTSAFCTPAPSPIGTIRPPSRSTSRAVSHVCGRPSTSKATSTPRPPVSSITASRAFSLAEFTVSVAPSSTAAASLSSATSIATIRWAPNALAIWITFDPTPPVATTATVSP